MLANIYIYIYIYICMSVDCLLVMLISSCLCTVYCFEKALINLIDSKTSTKY